MYQLDFPGMTRFFDDLSHVLQTGGMRNWLGQGGGSFADKVKNVIMFLIVVKLLYMLYIILFGGYPRFLINILTLSFFHKENFDLFLREDGMLLNIYHTLQYAPEGPGNPYEVIDIICGDKLGTKLYHKITMLKDLIKNYYKEHKYDNQFYEAMKEYYLLYDTADAEKITKDTITLPTRDRVIENKAFYEQLLGYYINIGKYDPKNKNDDQKLLDVYDIERNLNFPTFRRFTHIKQVMIEISNLIEKITGVFAKKPLSAFLVSPSNDLDHHAFASDFSKYEKEILDGSIYDKPYEALNEYSWYIIEVFQYRRNSKIYNEFGARMNGYNLREKYTIKKYLNVQSLEKKKAETRIFGRVLEKREPSGFGDVADIGRSLESVGDFKMNEPTYPPHERTTAAFFEYVKKRPTFAHIYFADDIPEDKAGFYQNVMSIYDRFLAPGTMALEKHANQFKKTLAAIFVFNLYCNDYRIQIMRAYQDQNFDNKFFFERLWKPYFVDFIINRMGNQFKRTFNKVTWNKSYKKFLVRWRQLGVLLKNIMKSTFKAFMQGTNVSAPTPEDV